MQNKILRIRSVIEKVGLSRSTIYALCKSGKFPKQICITDRCVGWLEEEIDEFLNQRASCRFA